MLCKTLELMMTETCHCCGNPATHREPSKYVAPGLPACDDCQDVTLAFHPGMGLILVQCPRHGVQEPVEVDDSQVEWFRARSKKTGQKYRESYPIKTVGDHRMSLLDYPDEHGLMIGETETTYDQHHF